MVDEVLGPEAQEIVQPELTLRFSVPKGATMEDSARFTKGLLAQIEAWHKEFEPDEPSVDLTQHG